MNGIRFCSTRKISYLTGGYAKRALKKIRANPRTTVVPSRAYRCEECGLYHLTSRGRSGRAKG